MPPFEAPPDQVGGRTSLARILIPVQHPIALPLRGDETLAGVLIRLHQRRDLVQGALVLGLDLNAGDDELAAVRVDVSNERQRGIDSIAERFGGIFERHCRRGHKPVERLVVDPLSNRRAV